MEEGEPTWGAISIWICDCNVEKFLSSLRQKPHNPIHKYKPTTEEKDIAIFSLETDQTRKSKLKFLFHSSLFCFILRVRTENPENVKRKKWYYRKQSLIVKDNNQEARNLRIQVKKNERPYNKNNSLD